MPAKGELTAGTRCRIACRFRAVLPCPGRFVRPPPCHPL